MVLPCASTQRRFGLFVRGDVREERTVVSDAAIAVEHRLDGELDRQARAVLADVLLLVPDGFSGANRFRQDLRFPLTPLRRREVGSPGEAPLLELLARVAGQIGKRAVEEHQAPVGRTDAEGRGGVFDDLREEALPLARLAQRLLGAPALGDVAVRLEDASDPVVPANQLEVARDDDGAAVLGPLLDVAGPAAAREQLGFDLRPRAAERCSEGAAARRGPSASSRLKP